MTLKPLLAPARRLPLALRVSLAVACAVLASGCASPGDTTPTAHALSAENLALAPVESSSTDTSSIATQWWLALGDAQLNALVQQALAHNPSLGVAQARWQAAQAASSAAGAVLAPQARLDASATDQRYSANGLIPPPLGGSVKDSGELQLGGSLALDLFGRHRAALAAAVGEAQAAALDARAVHSLVAAQVVQSYLAWAGLLGQRQAYAQQAQARQELHRLLALRQQAGLDSGLEPSRSDAESQATRVQLAQIGEALALAQDALAAWVGVAPAQLALHPVDLAQLPAMALPTAVGANLLGRRPDIAAARQRVLAAQDNLQAARAAFYPDVNLRAFAGLSSIGLDSLLDAGSRQWGAGAALSLPLFDGNALRAQAQARRAGVDLAIHTYNASLLTALREALDALARVQGAQQAWQAQQQVLQASQRTLTLQQRQLATGLAPRTGVLAAQATVATQQAQSLALRSRLLQSQAALALALGGGWQSTSSTQLN